MRLMQGQCGLGVTIEEIASQRRQEWSQGVMHFQARLSLKAQLSSACQRLSSVRACSPLALCCRAPPGTLVAQASASKCMSGPTFRPRTGAGEAASS